MNFPNRIIGEPLSAVPLIFGGVPDMPKCFADYCDDRRLVDRKFSRGANVQGESRSRPTENGFALLRLAAFCD
jgi:hypothetical protein